MSHEKFVPHRWYNTFDCFCFLGVGEGAKVWKTPLQKVMFFYPRGLCHCCGMPI